LDAQFPVEICVLGGASATWDADVLSIDSAEYLDLSLLSWAEKQASPLPPVPSNGPLTNASATAVAGGKVYIVGGVDSSGHVLASVEQLDLALGEWSSLPPMQTPRGGPAAVLAGDRLIVCGGDHVDRTLRSCEQLDMATSSWSELPSMRSPRRGAASVQLGSHIYVLGGDRLMASQPGRQHQEEPDWDVLATVEHLEIAVASGNYMGVRGAWRDLPSMCVARSAAAVTASGSCVYACGGQGSRSGDLLASAERFDLASRVWSLLAPMSTPRWGPVAAAVRGRIYVFGGWNETLGDLASAEYLDVSSEHWLPLPSMGTAHFRFSAVVSDLLSK